MKIGKTNLRYLGRNTMINFFGQLIVAIIAFILLPTIIKLLGFENYGLLSLALSVFGSFSLLELGLGRATTKFVAEYLNKGQFSDLSKIVWTSFFIQVLLGLIGTLLLIIFTPHIVNKLNISSHLHHEAKNILIILALSIPLLLGSSTFRGVLEGAQRFDFVNYTKISLNIFTYLIPFFGAIINLNIIYIVLLMMLTRFVGTISYMISSFYIIPNLKRIHIYKLKDIGFLFSYAGWVALSNVITPFLVQIDRFFIATLVSVTSITFYSIPFELLSAVWIIPTSIVSVLFPLFSSVSKKDYDDLKPLFLNSIKYMLLILGPIVVIVIFMAQDILLFWQGAVIAKESYLILQIILVGVLINSIGWIPSNFLSATGRPDIVAKIHLLQIPIYIAVLYFFISKYGIIGAAISFSIRVIIEAVLSFIFSIKIYPLLYKSITINFYRCIYLLLIFSTFLMLAIKANIYIKVFYGLILSIGYIYISFKYLISKEESRLILNFLKIKK